MANRCANINTPEFKQLVQDAEEKGMKEVKVIAYTHAWQTHNQTDAIPTYKELTRSIDDVASESDEMAVILKKDLSTMENVRKNLLQTIQLQINTIKGQTKDNETLKDFESKLKEMQEQLNDYDSLEHATAILNYLQSTEVLMKKLENQIDAYKKRNLDLANVAPEKVELDIHIISFFKKTLNNYALIPEIKKELAENTLEKDPILDNYEHKDILIDYIDTLTSRLDTAKREINTIARPRLARKFSMYSNRVRDEIKEKLTLEFKRKLPQQVGEKNQDFRDRIAKEVEKAMPSEKELSQQGFEYFMNKFKDVNIDVSAFSTWVNSALDINNQVVQVTNKILDEADLNRNTNMLETKLEVFDIFKENKNKLSGVNPEQQYKGRYNKASDGNLYYTTEYSPEFIIERNKLVAKREKAFDNFGKGSVQVQKAIAELKEWDSKNVKNNKPVDKWKDKNYESLKEDKIHNVILELAHKSDKNTQGNQSNIIIFKDTVEFIQAPNISRQGYEGLTGGNVISQLKDFGDRLYNPDKADITEYGNILPKEGKARRKEIKKLIQEKRRNNEDVSGLQDELYNLSVLTNSVGDIKNQIPIFYRGQNDLKTQSYDLLSIAMMDYYMSENYAQKHKIKDSIELLMDLVDESKFTQVQGGTKKILTKALGKSTYQEVEQMMGKDTNVAKVLRSGIDNRLYGIKTIQSEAGQIANTLMAWSAMTMLGLNYLASSANIIQGKVMNFIESVGAEFFDVKDLKKGETMFWTDMPDWMSDIGKPVQISKSHILMDVFDIQGEFKPFTNRMNEDNRFKYLFKSSHLFAMNNMGEFYIHGTLMYSILNNIKTKNAKGEFIDFNGAVTTKDKAMSLAEALTVDEKGNPQLNKHVKYTSHGSQPFSLDTSKGKGLLEVKGLINKLAHDLHGNYNDEIQAMSQRHVWGKMIFMLRKWVIPGFNRRFRGMATANIPVEALNRDQRFYSEYTQTFQEGHYTSFIRFLNNVRKDWSAMGMRAVSFNASMLSETEVANMRRTGAELSMIMMSWLASIVAYSLSGELDDEDEQAAIYAAFYSRRLFTELSFFINPKSTFQILRSPAASVSYFEDLASLTSQAVSDGTRLLSGEDIERYERTRRKGMSKLYKRVTDLTPILNVVDTEVKEQTSWFYNLE